MPRQPRNLKSGPSSPVSECPAWPRRQRSLRERGKSGAFRVNGTDSLFSSLDLRSFSNLWFWLMLAVAWSNVTHFVMGVPFDMVQRARRKGGSALADLEALAGIQARRRMQIFDTAGVWLVGAWMLVLSALATLGFGQGLELAQAFTLLLAPLTFAGWLGLHLAARVERHGLHGPALVRSLTRYRWLLQAIGLVSIFLTTLWGTWHTLSMRTLG